MGIKRNPKDEPKPPPGFELGVGPRHIWTTPDICEKIAMKRGFRRRVSDAAKASPKKR